MPCHDECKYHSIFTLEQWCRHPDHLEPLKPGRQCAIMSQGGKCASYIPWEAKVMPGAEPPWPMPVKMMQIVAIFAVSIRIAYKKAEESAKNDTRAA
jgi:hypothetical protein